MNRRQKILANSLLVLAGILIMLLIIEFALAFAGVEAILTPGFEPDLMPGTTCDAETGCFRDADYMTRDCTTAFHQGTSPTVRHCYVNEDAFFDSDSFVDNGDLGLYRILFLGDSFTFGYTASIGASWAEVAESQFSDLDVTVWNAGMPGSGTEQAIVNVERFAPVLNPDLVVLALNVNDLVDNLFPMDNWLILETDSPGGTWIQQYRLTEKFKVEKVSAASLYYRLQGVDVLEFSALERLLLATRTGSIILPRLAGLQIEGEPQTFFARPEGWYPIARETTSERVAELQTTVESYGAELLVLVIPDIYITPAHPTILDDINAMLESYGIPYITVDDLLLPDDYVNENPNDPHWNDSGHGKAGQRMGTCLRHIILNGSMCLQANIPALESP